MLGQAGTSLAAGLKVLGQNVGFFSDLTESHLKQKPD